MLTFWLLVASIFCDCTLAANVINASAIPYEQQTYKFDRENLCRLLAHKSKSVYNRSLCPAFKAHIINPLAFLTARYSGK